jgi:hypothetical protein
MIKVSFAEIDEAYLRNKVKMAIIVACPRRYVIPYVNKGKVNKIVYLLF